MSGLEMQQVISDSGLKVATVAKRMGYSRGHLYHLFNETQLSDEVNLRLTQALRIATGNKSVQVQDLDNITEQTTKTTGEKLKLSENGDIDLHGTKNDQDMMNLINKMSDSWAKIANSNEILAQTIASMYQDIKPERTAEFDRGKLKNAKAS